MDLAVILTYRCSSRCSMCHVWKHPTRPEAEVTPAVLDAFRAALTLDFGGGQSRAPEALCRELVPDLDQIPVKRPLTLADLPLDGLDLGDDATAVDGSAPERKPRRNDPCWCGSGKKYKHRHWRQDRKTR